MARWKVKDALRNLAYVLNELERADLNPARREMLEQKAEHLRRVTAGHCVRCGKQARDLDDRGYGVECRKQVAA